MKCCLIPSDNYISVKITDMSTSPPFLYYPLDDIEFRNISNPDQARRHRPGESQHLSSPDVVSSQKNPFRTVLSPAGSPQQMKRTPVTARSTDATTFSSSSGTFSSLSLSMMMREGSTPKQLSTERTPSMRSEQKNTSDEEIRSRASPNASSLSYNVVHRSLMQHHAVSTTPGSVHTPASNGRKKNFSGSNTSGMSSVCFADSCDHVGGSQDGSRGSTAAKLRRQDRFSRSSDPTLALDSSQDQISLFCRARGGDEAGNTTRNTSSIIMSIGSAPSVGSPVQSHEMVSDHPRFAHGRLSAAPHQELHQRQHDTSNKVNIAERPVHPGRLDDRHMPGARLASPKQYFAESIVHRRPSHRHHADVSISSTRKKLKTSLPRAMPHTIVRLSPSEADVLGFNVEDPDEHLFAKKIMRSMDESMQELCQALEQSELISSSCQDRDKSNKEPEKIFHDAESDESRILNERIETLCCRLEGLARLAAHHHTAISVSTNALSCVDKEMGASVRSVREARKVLELHRQKRKLIHSHNALGEETSTEKVTGLFSGQSEDALRNAKQQATVSPVRQCQRHRKDDKIVTADVEKQCGNGSETVCKHSREDSPQPDPSQACYYSCRARIDPQQQTVGSLPPSPRIQEPHLQKFRELHLPPMVLPATWSPLPARVDAEGRQTEFSPSNSPSRREAAPPRYSISTSEQLSDAPVGSAPSPPGIQEATVISGLHNKTEEPLSSHTHSRFEEYISVVASPERDARSTQVTPKHVEQPQLHSLVSTDRKLNYSDSPLEDGLRSQALDKSGFCSPPSVHSHASSTFFDDISDDLVTSIMRKVRSVNAILMETTPSEALQDAQNGAEMNHGTESDAPPQEQEDISTPPSTLQDDDPPPPMPSESDSSCFIPSVLLDEDESLSVAQQRKNGSRQRQRRMMDVEQPSTDHANAQGRTPPQTRALIEEITSNEKRVKGATHVDFADEAPSSPPRRLSAYDTHSTPITPYDCKHEIHGEEAIAVVVSALNRVSHEVHRQNLELAALIRQQQPQTLFQRRQELKRHPSITAVISPTQKQKSKMNQNAPRTRPAWTTEAATHKNSPETGKQLLKHCHNDIPSRRRSHQQFVSPLHPVTATKGHPDYIVNSALKGEAFTVTKKPVSRLLDYEEDEINGERNAMHVSIEDTEMKQKAQVGIPQQNKSNSMIFYHFDRNAALQREVI